MESNKLVISNFSKRYGSSKRFAVKNANIEVNGGEVFGFIGHNGAGKSTTIKSLVGIQKITEGSITICGYDISKNPLDAKRLIGYVSDNHASYEELSGRKYLTIIAKMYGADEKTINDRIDSLANDFNLLPAIDKPIKDYSHGMKQKLVIISSIVHEPKVWVLDEPLTGLDPSSAITLKKKMREYADKGNIVFFSSHIIEVVEKICDRIAIINHGHIMCQYSTKELEEQHISLEDLFLKYYNAKVEDEDCNDKVEDKK